MAAIQNDRDLLLQAASPRVVPIPTTIDEIPGLAAALKSIRITASDTVFVGTSGVPTPATITLTAMKINGLTGPVAWQVIAGAATIAQSGDTCVVTGSTVTGRTVTIRARVADGGQNYDAQIVLTRLGSLSGQEAVNLATQITGQLANGNVSGLKALALLDSVSLSNPIQVVGDLAASRIGVGQLAAGVVYAGTVNVENLIGTNISGKNLVGTDFIYIAGFANTAPLVMQKVGNDEVRFTMRGFFDVGRTDGQGGFNIATNGNLSHGSITLGSSASFLGSSFRVSAEAVTYANLDVNRTTGVTLRHNAINLQDAAGTPRLTVTTARTTVRSGFLNLPQPNNVSGATDGDMCIVGGEVVFRVGGANYKLTKTVL